MSIFLTRRLALAGSIIVALALSIVLPINEARAQQPVESPSAKPLLTRMTPEEFSAAGLHKLTESERAALDRWLEDHLAPVPVMPAPAPKAGSSEKSEVTTRVEARVTGNFSGWDGDTTFVLDNGQVWRQRMPGNFSYTGPANPLVVISENIFGFPVLKVSGTKRGIGVERVK